MYDSQYILFFKTNFLCKGYQRSIIFDPAREQYIFVPNSLADILEVANKFTIGQIKRMFNDKDGVIDSYIDLLLKLEFIIITKNKSLIGQFPPLNQDWQQPYIITNAIVIINTLNELNIKSIEALCKIGCPYLEIRLLSKTDLNIFEEKIIKPMLQYKIQTVHLYIGFSLNSVLFDFLDELFKRYFFIRYYYNCGQNERIENLGIHIECIDFNKGCGIVHRDLFSLQLPHYTESLAHNTCLNRKIAIDAEGNIKNCPSMKESYGNIKDTTLEEALGKPGFKKYWNITKDQITKCKDCEFRHICTDCRAYTDNPEDIYSAPLKCGYDPYTCTWEEWSTNPLKQQAIDHYAMWPVVKRS
jgi:SPASM domain peptide maturase of grasp-with-spasm system